jgi:metallophosphoesterase superfamily enzyme
MSFGLNGKRKARALFFKKEEKEKKVLIMPSFRDFTKGLQKVGGLAI